MTQLSLNLWWPIGWGCFFGWALQFGQLLGWCLALAALNLVIALIATIIDWLESRELKRALKDQEEAQASTAIYEPEWMDFIRGDCRFYSGSRDLKCAIAPSTLCQLCTQFEPKNEES